jgi:hypothetical protein
LNPKYAPLLHNLNEQLNFIDLEIDNPIQQCEQAINVILKSIHAVRKMVAKANFKSEGEEIQFFKEVKPQFTSKLIYYNQIYQIERKKPSGGDRILRKYY